MADYQRHLARALESIACRNDAKNLSAETLEAAVIQQMQYWQIPNDKHFHDPDAKARAKVDTPEFWKWAGRRDLKVLLDDLVRLCRESFMAHLNCENAKSS